MLDLTGTDHPSGSNFSEIGSAGDSFFEFCVFLFFFVFCLQSNKKQDSYHEEGVKRIE